MKLFEHDGDWSTKMNYTNISSEKLEKLKKSAISLIERHGRREGFILRFNDFNSLVRIIEKIDAEFFFRE